MNNFTNLNIVKKIFSIVTIVLFFTVITVNSGYCLHKYPNKVRFNNELKDITSKKANIMLADIQSGQIISISNPNIAYKGYTTGSLAKIIAATALLEKNIMSTDQTYNCNGYAVINGKKVHCWNPNGHGKNNIESALAQSCNLFFLEYSKKLNSKDLLNYYEVYKLNLNRQIQDSKNLSGSNIPKNGVNIKIAIGLDQKLLISPVAMLSLSSTLARNGVYKPLWINEPTNISKKLEIKPSTISVIQNGMIRSGKEGTSKLFHKKGFDVAAKTGTAPYGENGKHGWVIGYYPANKPKIAFCVFVADGTGFSDAVPIALKVLNLCKKYHYI